MKLRHAAALALVGWYLMVPPAGIVFPDPNSPRIFMQPFDRTWRVKATFISANDCEIAREKHEADFARGVKSTIPKGYENHPTRSLHFDDGALCIATDDPRLKGK